MVPQNDTRFPVGLRPSSVWFTTTALVSLLRRGSFQRIAPAEDAEPKNTVETMSLTDTI